MTLRRYLLLALLIALGLGWWLWQDRSPLSPVYVFNGVVGPSHKTVLPPPAPAIWKDHDQGSQSRLAILLTDPDSAWLGLVHGLRSMGVPLRITRDYKEALRHRVVLVYPTISGRVLPAEALQALIRFPEKGGTLIGVNVEGGGMAATFGFTDIAPARTRQAFTLDASHLRAQQFDDALERTVPFSNTASGADAAGSLGYLGAQAPLASFEDGSAAITARSLGSGHAYAFGVDIGFMLLTGYNNREQGVARSYVNRYEPALDVVLRLLQDIYRQGEPHAVTLNPVPQGKSLAVVISHDVDYTTSLANANAYADYETSVGIKATYFIQTKYVRDWNDQVFFNEQGLEPLRKLRAAGMEIGSHSVAHAMDFHRLPLGSGDEQYPAYRPLVRDKEKTEEATILGELRVSRFLLEHFLPDYQINSFRPGHLRNPYVLPQALQATGYQFSSSVTANNSLTHLPFRLTYSRETAAPSAVYEFPVTIEDESAPPLGSRLPEALRLAERLARYGGLFMVLIHTDITGHKLEFERGLVEALRPTAWFGTLGDYGRFWQARDRIGVDILPNGQQLVLQLSVPVPVDGLSLDLPMGYRAVTASPSGVSYTQQGARLVIDKLTDDATLTLVRDGSRPYANVPFGSRP
ncbi:hypothetical protein ED236_02190 [Pseudomethylobacillus aquaticus]|uniref:NodB homology domain-containing protein n=1 Tax=Pseudomethylobacillus aquaticus TaxID=2676064 RepID=A0A3N0V679_9PROT|nr:polysaccharide deacetylase family protein [Pseudomethylobacillus aquaticus]ROH88296.1 hypothetical protein ED236_02190 [Pseudomethylobacillus aquaticus]